MTEFGLDPSKAMMRSGIRKQSEDFWKYIEQGPLLEKRGLPVGVVTDIAGARRFEFIIEGKAGHSGTVPMLLRNDALLGPASVQAVEEATKRFDVLATVGQISREPGAVNVIPGNVNFS